MTDDKTAQVITFRSGQKTKKTRQSRGRIKNVDGIKYFNERQIKLLRRTAREQAELDEKKATSRVSGNGWSSICDINGLEGVGSG